MVSDASKRLLTPQNGENYPAWESINAVRDTEGRVTHYLAVQSDISSMKRAEERLTCLAITTR